MMRPKPPSAPLIVILGSTGTGKSDLAVELATRFNGEIVNADAMQMYKGLPIITNKISIEEQKAVPHHLLGTISIDQPTWDAYVFKQEASKIIRQIRNRGRLPIVVGGTHFYINGLLFNDILVEEDEHGNDKVNAEYDQHQAASYADVLNDTTENLWKRLKEVDPVMANKWHPNDRRKIQRSLEIYLQTGKPASEIYAEQRARKAGKLSPSINAQDEIAGQGIDEAILFWVYTNKQTLNDRLDSRVDKMLDRGLMDELQHMDTIRHRSPIQDGTSIDVTKGIWQSIGVKEFRPYFEIVRTNEVEQCKSSQSDCINAAGSPFVGDVAKVKHDNTEAMKAATRRYAKNQLRWISRKTLPLLLQSGAHNVQRLYMLDSTDPTMWTAQVSEPAEDTTAKFLDGTDLPGPSSIASDGACEALSAMLDTAKGVVNGDDVDNAVRSYCDICKTTSVTAREWELHLKGRAHQRKLRESKRGAVVPWGKYLNKQPEV